MNVAYRWFLQLKLTDPLFDASTLSQTLDPRVNGKWVIDLFAQAIERPTHRFNRPLG